MQPIPRHGPVPIALAVAAGVALAACSDHLTPRAPVMSQAQADSMGQVVAADAENELDAGTAASGIGFIPGAPSRLALLSPQGCIPLISPLPAVNSDSDRVPDSIRVTFNDCVIDFRRGADTIRGSIDIVDPTPTGTDRSLRLVFTDLARIFVDNFDHTASITVNGSREAIRDSSELSQTETDFRTDYLFGNGATASHVRNWAVDFTADVAGSIVHDAPLPSGVLTITGSSTFTRDGTTAFDLQVTTPTPLHFDATCTDRPRFSTGTLVAVATKDGATTTVTIQFTACGQFTVTRS
jgi:hypothetical protein